MKKNVFSCLLLFLLSIAGCSPDKDMEKGETVEEVQIPSIEVKAQTDRTTATTSETITFTLSVLYSPGIKVRLPEPGSKIAGLRVVDFGEDGPVNMDTRLVYKKWYALRADIAGTYIIPSMNISYTDTDNTEKKLETPQIFLEVKSGASDDEEKQLEDIIDIKPLQETNRDLTLFIIAGSAAIIASLIVICVLFYLRKKRQRRQEIQKPAHVLALEALDNLKKEKLIEKGVVREHYFRLSDIFRRYIENRFNLRAVESTTQELLPEITKLDAMTESARSTTLEFLLHSDMVKFAKYPPTQEEIDKSHQEIVTVINETKQENEQKLET